MKKPSTSVYLRPNKNKTQYFINVRYTYDRQSFPVPIGNKIADGDWDAKRERVNFNVVGSAVINEKIKDVIATLERISNNHIEQGKEPTIQVMKVAYADSVKFKEYLNEQDIEMKPVLLAKAGDIRAQIEELEKQIEILKKEERKNLRHAGALPPTVFEEQESEAEKAKRELLSLLNEYLREKTGVDLTTSKEALKAVKKAFESTPKAIRSWAKTFAEFVNSKEANREGFKLGLDNLNGQFYNTYAEFLMNPKGHNFYNNTFGAHVKKLITFLKWVDLDKGLSIDRRYSRFEVLTEETEVIILRRAEIDLLYQYQPKATGRTNAKDLRKYIDFTVFSCLTGLRISDVKRVKGFVIENGFLMGKTKKTRNQFKIPLYLDSRIAEILERYNNNLYLFSEQEYNRTLKKLIEDFCNEYDIHQEIITITKYKFNQAYEFKHRFWDLYTSHNNRRYFVTNMRARGFAQADVMEIMGTKSDREFQKYNSKDIIYLNERLSKLIDS